MRLIDLNVLLELVKKNAPFIYSILLPIAKMCPTIEAEPVRHGVWTTMVWTNTGKLAGYKCSECGIVEYRNYDRCRCGAIMDGGASDA